MLKEIGLQDIRGGINLIDVGASGRLDPRWKPIEHLINLVGFDPNAEECERLSRRPSPFASAKYLPYALAGQRAQATLYKTKSIYCYSLLQPDHQWLQRFSFGNLFEVTDTEAIETHPLNEIQELANVDIDAMKIDTQGLELPILSNAGSALSRAFYVETETGFVQNYQGETTYAQIDQFMRDNGFILFDLNVQHRVARRNLFANKPSGNEQILWCEAVWLKDYVHLAKSGSLADFDRAKSIKVLLLCALVGCYDFGLELAQLFHQHGWVSASELRELGRVGTWRLSRSRTKTLFGTLLRVFPKRTRRAIAQEAERVSGQPDLIKTLYRSRTKRRAA